MNPEFKTLTFELKAAGDDTGNGEFEAVLSTPAIDREGETVQAKAFDPLPPSIPIHWQHDFVRGGLPIGKGVPYYDGDTLKIKGEYAPTEKAQEVRALVNGEFVTSMSAGFLTTQRKGKSVIRGDLLEGSMTATPINTSAMVLASKALDLEPDVKAGARNSSADQQRVQSMHDHAVALGADCGATKAVDPETPELETKAAAPSDAAEKAAANDAAADADELDLQRQRARVWQITA